MARWALVVLAWAAIAFGVVLFLQGRAQTDVRPAEAPIVISGVGSLTTQPFHLAGGTYRGQWSAWGQGPEWPPCTHSVQLLAVEAANPSPADLADRVQVPGTGASDQRDMYDLQPGEYYLDVHSACSWQVALSRQ